MSMWSPQSPPHPQSLGPRAVGHCCCFPACQGLASLLPLPQPGPWGQLQGLGESQIAKTQVTSSPIWEAGSPHASALSVPAGNTQTQSPRPQQRALGRQSQWPSLTPSHLGLPAWSGIPGLSVFIASTCAVLWARWPAASAPRLGATIPGRPSLDPARTTVGPSVHSWSRPLCLPPSPPSLVRPGLDHTGTCPCFSFSDQEIPKC